MILFLLTSKSVYNYKFATVRLLKLNLKRTPISLQILSAIQIRLLSEI